MITIKVDEDTLLQMLVDRCNFWEVSRDNKDLFEQMYQSQLDNGVFEGAEFDPMVIVDNDVVNYCDIITKEDNGEDFEKLLALYKEGEYDVSTEDFEDIYPAYIEAVSDDETRILVRVR